MNLRQFIVSRKPAGFHNLTTSVMMYQDMIDFENVIHMHVKVKPFT